MIGILTQQLQLFRTLVEVLNSRGVVETGDVQAFLALVQHHQKATEPLVDAAHQMYLEAAQSVGVVTGLES
jgi:hypothetical protein